MQMPGQITSPEARLASTVREARARIMWGESTAGVREWMVDAGVDADYADQVIRTAMHERGGEIRIQGLKELIVGAVIFVACGGLLLMFLFTGFISVVILGGCGGGAAFGLFKILRGLARMIAGAHANVDVSDL